MVPAVFRVVLAALVGMTVSTSAQAQASPVPPLATEADAQEPGVRRTPSDGKTHGLLMIEARPWLRPGLVFLHRVSAPLRLEHSLTVGLAELLDFELRTTAEWTPLGPARPWASFRIRRIDLPELPPVENSVALGIGVASAPEKTFSLIGNLGLSFQVPPLSRYASRDFGSYVGENVGVVLLFGARVRVW